MHICLGLYECAIPAGFHVGTTALIDLKTVNYYYFVKRNFTEYPQKKNSVLTLTNVI
jgi:hypothetical protein